MKIITVLLLIAALAGSSAEASGSVDKAQQDEQAAEHRILVFSKTEGYRHQSIGPGKEALLRLGKEHGVAVDTTENASEFNESNLENYSAVVFLSPSGKVFNEKQRKAFKSYIQNGGGFAGIHGANTVESEWGWFSKLVGAQFDDHPVDPGVRPATLNVVDRSHPATSHLPGRWDWADEWYNFYNFYDWVNIIMTVDTDTYEGSKHPLYHPIAWYHEFDGGRSFYTAIGHASEAFSDGNFLKHIWGGIEYAMGRETKN